MTHLDTDVLAEFRAGLISGRRGARIAAHLAGCARCAALDDQLAGVCSLLASVPAPAMPDRVAQRLDTVLAAEVAQRGMSQGDQAERAHGDGAGESPAPRRPNGNRGFRLLTLRVLAPAAAVVLLAAGGYGLSRIGLGSSTESAASTSAGDATRAAPTAAPTAAGSAKSAARANAPAAGPQGITPAIIVRISHRNFSHAGFKQQVQAELRVPSGSLATEAARAQVRGCVEQVAGTYLVQRVESVRYDGRPATLIVARTGADDTAWIAAPDCSATYRHVLDTTSLPSGISGP
jgi:hypothetical protein